MGINETIEIQDTKLMKINESIYWIEYYIHKNKFYFLQEDIIVQRIIYILHRVKNQTPNSSVYFSEGWNASKLIEVSMYIIQNYICIIKMILYDRGDLDNLQKQRSYPFKENNEILNWKLN